jgi:hypothetical protein
MKTTALITTALITTAGAFMACTTLHAQNVVFQQAGVISADANITISGPVLSGPGASTITGSPFSATEQTHSLQILGDGSRIEQSNAVQISRDSDGRTRREPVSTASEKADMVTIQDPVAGANYLLDPLGKTATKLPLPKLLSARVVAAGQGIASTSSASITASSPASFTSLATTVRVAGGGELPQVMSYRASPVNIESAAAPVQDDLGTQNINGVVAKGTRSTITIPTGQIGNDRPLQVINERWYSEELGMLIKTSNSDPRFGTTTYELTNISRAAPDPTLFQVPADYSINESKAMFRTSVPKQPSN